jgi:hypothetical protein
MNGGVLNSSTTKVHEGMLDLADEEVAEKQYIGIENIPRQLKPRSSGGVIAA